MTPLETLQKAEAADHALAEEMDRIEAAIARARDDAQAQLRAERRLRDAARLGGARSAGAAAPPGRPGEALPDGSRPAPAAHA